MSREELPRAGAITASEVYARAEEVLDTFGYPSLTPTIQLRHRPGGRPRLTRGPTIPAVEAPIIPVQIGDREYKLWMRKEDKDQPKVTLTVHFNSLPDGLVGVEHNEAGFVSRYWVLRENQVESALDEWRYYDTSLRSMPGPRRTFCTEVRMGQSSLPKELDFGWYVAETYEIRPGGNRHGPTKYVKSDVLAPLGHGNEFLLDTLEKMKEKLS